jgi:MYXO-CTERM domain-containing protein
MRKTLGMGALVVGTALVEARPAIACGACFHGPVDVSADSTVVNEHHMVFAVSKTQTVLWDQIRYSGNPKDFAWVLPVRPGTKVEISNDAFIKALDAFTAPVVLQPVPPPGNGKAPAFSCSCGSEDSEATFVQTTDAGASNPVNVVTDIVVGPYEAVTLHATDGQSLNAWLASHQYEVPNGFQPTIDAYVKEGFDFIALRLLPNTGIQSMRPVRVVTKGADTTLPLRMVAAGVGAKVGLVLYVIGEGRYHTANFPDVTVDDQALTWDYATYSSNYSTLAEAAMNTANGTGVLTDFAGYMFQPDFSGRFSSAQQAYQQAITFAQSKGDQCVYLPQIVDAGTDASDADIADASSDDASTDDASIGIDSGADAGATQCIYDDISVATTGMATADVWLTRLRMNLPAPVLGQGDLHIAATTQTLVSNRHQVPTPGANEGCATHGDSDPGNWTALAFGALGVVLVARRRRRH